MGTTDGWTQLAPSKPNIARLAGGLLHGGEVVVVGDGAHQPEREHAGGLGGVMHHQLGEMQHLRRRLGAERGGEVLAAGGQRIDRAASPPRSTARRAPRRDPRSSARAASARGRTHARSPSRNPESAASARASAHLRHEQAERPGPARRLGIEPDQVGIGVDAHEYDGAALGRPTRRLRPARRAPPPSARARRRPRDRG